MASYYPHKWTVIITIICALAVAGTAVYAQWTRPVEKQLSAVVSSPSNDTAPIVADSSSWKNQFFLAGSSTPPKTRASNSTVKEDSSPTTLTDQIGRDFFAHYIDLKQSNLTTDNTAVQSVVTNTLDKAVGGASQPKLYSSTDIRVSANEDAVSIRAYGNAVGTVFSLYAPRTDAATIASSAFEKGDMKLLAQIDPIITEYKKTISAMTQLPVPAPLAEQHLALTNGLSSMLYVSQGLRLADKDPMQSMVALGTYNTAITILRGALQGMKTYFDSRNVFFSGNEQGTMFLGVSSL